MTERTHDMAALTLLTLSFAYLPLTPITLSTLVVVILANQIGSAFPDLDQPTAEFYRELPAGTYIGRLLAPLLGSHRLISHSLVGMAIIGYLLNLLLNYLSQIILIDMQLVWWSFMLGFFSHLVADTLTKEGVPWLFPLPFRFGFPPFRFLRIETGKFMEKLVLYPALSFLNLYILYSHYDKVKDFLNNYLVK